MGWHPWMARWNIALTAGLGTIWSDPHSGTISPSVITTSTNMYSPI